MLRDSKIHIFGASGSGATTLGAALAAAAGIRHLDTDDYYWKQTDPPFVEKIDPAVRITNIRNDVRDLGGWVLSSSLCSWGDPLISDFTLVVFLHLDQSVRMQRLRARENQRYGGRIAPSGDMYAQHMAFMAWAESYDSAKSPVRSYDLHTKWMRQLHCPILRLDSELSPGTLVEAVACAVAKQSASQA